MSAKAKDRVTPGAALGALVTMALMFTTGVFVGLMIETEPELEPPAKLGAPAECAHLCDESGYRDHANRVDFEGDVRKFTCICYGGTNGRVPVEIRLR